MIIQDIGSIKNTLERHKKQARKLYPNAVVVPYERAMKAVDNVVRYYEEKIKRMKDHDKEENTKEKEDPGDTDRCTETG